MGKRLIFILAIFVWLFIETLMILSWFITPIIWLLTGFNLANYFDKLGLKIFKKHIWSFL